MADDDTLPRWPFLYNVLFGTLYLTIGITDILSALGISIFPFRPKDIMSPLMLLITGIVFLAGTPMLKRRDEEGYAFTLVATILAAILFALQTLVLISNALGWVLGLEDWTEWNVISDITPAVWLFFLVAVAFWILKTTNRLGGDKGIFPASIGGS